VDGRLQFTEAEYIVWSGEELRVDAGPVAIPDDLAVQIRALFSIPDILPEAVSACGYLPRYRISLEGAREGEQLYVFVMKCYDSFEVYRNGVRIGRRSPRGADKEVKLILQRLEELFSNAQRPNKSLQPTATAVTPPAAQEIVPAVAVAEH
jgi:hypothetical protein